MTAGIITGLEIEAAIARRGGLQAHASGAVPDAARELARGFARDGARALVSFGVAGALAPDLTPGALILADAVQNDGRRIACDAAWLACAAARLPQARIGTVWASDRIIATRLEKRTLAAAGALAVDMESGAVAEVAQEFGLPLLVVRAVADRAEDEIPAAAAAALQPEQSTRAFLGALARQPRAVPVLIGLGWRTGSALRALNRAVRMLGADLAGP